VKQRSWRGDEDPQVWRAASVMVTFSGMLTSHRRLRQRLQASAYTRLRDDRLTRGRPPSRRSAGAQGRAGISDGGQPVRNVPGYRVAKPGGRLDPNPSYGHAGPALLIGLSGGHCDTHDLSASPARLGRGGRQTVRVLFLIVRLPQPRLRPASTLPEPRDYMRAVEVHLGIVRHQDSKVTIVAASCHVRIIHW